MGVDLQRVDLQNKKFICLGCGVTELFASSGLTQGFSEDMEEFRQEHATCTMPDHDFKPGDKVEFCGIEGTVVENYGSSGLVDVPGDGRVAWYWVFQGTPVRRINANSNS